MSESPEPKETQEQSSEGNLPDEPDFGIPGEMPAGIGTTPAAATETIDENSDKNLNEKRKIFTRKNLKDLFLGLLSPDRPTRKMTVFFYLSLFVFIALMGSFGKNWYRSVVAKKKVETALLVEAEKKAPWVLKAKEKDLIKLQLNLGEFMLELRPRQEEAGDAKGTKVYSKDHMNIATIELIAECDTVDTCHFVEEHIVQVRDQMILILTGLEREVLMSREGKQKVKRALIDRLNRWLGDHGISDKTLNKAPIENLYFNRLVLT